MPGWDIHWTHWKSKRSFKRLFFFYDHLSTCRLLLFRYFEAYLVLNLQHHSELLWNSLERSQQVLTPGRTIATRACRASTYIPVILERKDAVMLSLVGEQRWRDSEQSHGYLKNSHPHSPLSLSPIVLFHRVSLYVWQDCDNFTF